MSGRRSALIERFRARAQERLATVRAAIAGDSRPSDEDWEALLGGFHTLKGEARMLGLGSLANLTHALEETLYQRGDEWPSPTIAGVPIGLDGLEAMLLAQPLVEDAKAEALLDRALAEISQKVIEAPAAALERAGQQPTPVEPAEHLSPSPRAARGNRIVELEAAQVDLVCDALEQLRTHVGQLMATGAQLDRMALEDLTSRIGQLTESASNLRLATIEPMLSTLGAHARVLAGQYQRKLVVTIDGGGAQLERGVLDALEEPLLHLVRNAVDHGTTPERQGQIALRVEPHSDTVTLTVEDDGPGLDPEALRRAAITRGLLDAAGAAGLSDEDALQLIFLPRFSTRQEATELSGRGIGLDVVRRITESLGGAVRVASTPGSGTRFVLEVPMRLTRERVVVVGAGELLFGIPSRQVVAIVPIAQETTHVGVGGRAISIDEEQVPLVSLFNGEFCDEDERYALIIEVNERKWALAVANLANECEVLRRPADKLLRAFETVSASAVLDDGRPVLIPALADLVRRAGVCGARASRANGQRPVDARPERRALIVDDSPTVRELLAELLSSTGLMITQAEDGAAGLHAWDNSRAFDLVVTDVEMPNIDGFELVKRLRARGAQMPIMVVTTRGSAEDRRRAAACGADAYFVKTDFRERELLALVRDLMDLPIGASPR